MNRSRKNRSNTALLKTATKVVGLGATPAKAHTVPKYAQWQGQAFKIPTPAFTLKNGLRVWGCGQRNLDLLKFTPSLLVRLNDDLASRFDHVAPMVKANLEAMAAGFGWAVSVEPPTLDLDWPDGGIPRLDKDWWALMALKLRQMDDTETPGQNVVIACMGGRGRTGTALSILWGMLGLTLRKKDGYDLDPVEAIRQLYDPDAVETNTQLDYIENMLGITLYTEASGMFGWNEIDPRDDPNEQGTGSVLYSAKAAAEVLLKNQTFETEDEQALEEARGDYLPGSQRRPL